MSVFMRQRVERAIARRFILDATHAGYSLGVHDGGELVLERSRNVRKILNAMFSVDEEHLVVFKDDKQIGWVFFVYGNDGWDVISDYTVNLDKLGLMKGASELADKYGG